MSFRWRYRYGRSGPRQRYRVRRRRPQMAWLDIPITSLTQLTGASGTVVDKLCGAEQVKDKSGSTELDWSRQADPLIVRIILTVAVTLTNTATRALLRYWWGIRLADYEPDGDLQTAGDLLLTNDRDRRWHWLYRDSTAVMVSPNASAGDVVALSNSPGESVLRMDIKPRGARLHQGSYLGFYQLWQMQAGTAPDCTYVGRLNGRILLSLQS